MHKHSRDYLESLAQKGFLSSTGLQLALRTLHALPTPADWRRFIDRLLLASGVLLILAGVIFFFAYNWQGLHRFSKMALILLPLLAATGGALQWGCKRNEGQAALGAAFMLTGALLALIGQTYQSGADSELLFAAWAALTLPWVIVSTAPWLWIFWLLVSNTALCLYVSSTNLLMRWDNGTSSELLIWLPFLWNTAALCAWEVASSKISALRVAYAPRLLHLASSVLISVLSFFWWFNEPFLAQTPRAFPFIYALWLFASLWFYKNIRHDIAPQAFAFFSLIIVLTTGIAKFLFKARFGDAGAFFFTGVAIIAMTALAVFYLRQNANNANAANIHQRNTHSPNIDA